MTEKRFTLTHIKEQHISANIYDNKTFIASIGIGAELIVELLNSLNDENVKLQARNKYLAMKIQRERNIHVKEHEKWEEEIQKENEQLKKILGFLKNDNAEDILNVLNLQETEIWKVKRENEQLKHDATVLIQANQDYRRENEQLKSRIHYLERKIDKERISYCQKQHEKWKKELKSE